MNTIPCIQCSSYQSPTLFFANGLGDTVLALPTLRAISSIFKGELTIITSTSPGAELLTTLSVRKIIRADMIMEEQGLGFDVGRVRDEIGYSDLFIGLVPWLSDALTKLLSQLRPSLSIGYYSCYDVQVPLNFARHSADLAFDCARILRPDADLDQFAWPIQFPAARTGLANAIRNTRRMQQNYVYCIHADSAREKRWTQFGWREVVQNLLEAEPNSVVVAVGAEPELSDQWPCGERIIPLYGATVISSMAVVAVSDFFIGIDSCMLHVADLARVPGVGLFGATDPAEFGFRWARHAHVRSPTLNRIESSAVLKAIRQVRAPDQGVTTDNKHV